MLSLDELRAAVGDGSIDTVVVAFTDMTPGVYAGVRHRCGKTDPGGVETRPVLRPPVLDTGVFTRGLP